MRSAGTMRSLWLTTATPMRSSCRTNSPCGSCTRKPGIDSSLSTVPPVCPSPRPDILPKTAPLVAACGASTSVTLSPTPPLECLSSTGRRTTRRSSVLPLSTMARASSTVSASLKPWSTIAMSSALAWYEGTEPPTTPSTKARRRPASSSRPSRFQAITSFTKSTGRPPLLRQTRPGQRAVTTAPSAAASVPARRPPKASTCSCEPTAAALLTTSARRQQAAPAARAARTSGAPDMPTTSPWPASQATSAGVSNCGPATGRRAPNRTRRPRVGRRRPRGRGRPRPAASADRPAGQRRRLAGETREGRSAHVLLGAVVAPRREAERQERRVLARVIGARGRRVHAVIGAEQHDVAVAQQRPPQADRRVHGGQPRGEAGHVVAVTPLLVEVDEVGEQQAAVHLLEVTGAGGDAGGVVGGVVVHIHAALHEDLADLADADHGHRALVQQVEIRRAQRRQREVAAPRRALVGARHAGERARDHPPYGVGAAQDAARYLAPAVQLGYGHNVLVTGDLEDGIGRRVHDRPAARHMLVAELVDDAGARGREVAEHPAADGPCERLHHVRRKAVRVRRKRAFEDDAHHLPVAGGGVFAGAVLHEATIGRLRPRRSEREAHDLAEPQPDQIGQLDSAALEHVPQGVGPGVAVGGCIRELTGPAAVEDADEHARHVGSSSPPPVESAAPASGAGALRRRARGCVSRKTSRRCSTVT